MLDGVDLIFISCRAYYANRTCVKEEGVWNYLRLIFKQKVLLTPLVRLVSNSSTTPKAQQHGTMGKISRWLKYYVSVQIDSPLFIFPSSWLSSSFASIYRIVGRISSQLHHAVARMFSSGQTRQCEWLLERPRK